MGWANTQAYSLSDNNLSLTERGRRGNESILITQTWRRDAVFKAWHTNHLPRLGKADLVVNIKH